jgi:hypothetical protein
MSTVTAAVVFQARRDDAGHGLRRGCCACRQALFADEAHEGARAVAALFDFAAVVVEDAVAEIAAGLGRRFDHQDLVGADAEAAVGQAAPLRGRELDLLVVASMTMKSLPAPCILVNLSFMEVDP